LCRNLALLVPLVDIDVWRYLLPVDVIGGLQDGVAEAEGYGEIGQGTPAVLKEPLEFVCPILARNGGAVRQLAGTLAIGIDGVVVDIVQFRDRADEIGVSNQVVVAEASANSGVCRFGDGTADPIWVGTGGVEGICIGEAVIADKPPVYAALHGVVAVGPGDVIDDVMHRNVDDGRASVWIDVIDEAEVDVILGERARIGVSLADVAVAKVVNQG
jgi:hypothetical protein